MWATATTIISGGDWNDPVIWSGGNIADDISKDAEMNNTLLGPVIIRNLDDYTISDLVMNNDNTLTIDAGGSLTIGSFTDPRDLTAGNVAVINVNGDLEIWGDMIILNDLILNVTFPGTAIVHGDLDIGPNATVDVQGLLTIEGNLLGGNNANVNVDGTLNVNGYIDIGNNSNLTGTGTVNLGEGCTGPASFCDSGPLSGVTTAGAGPDATVCYNTSHTLVGAATNGTILWTTSGTGTFDDATLEDPIYTFSAADITTGTVTLTITVTGTPPADDDVVLTVDPEATAAAGADAAACLVTHQLAASATNGTILWTTSGDGTFNDATLEDPVYTSGSGDIREGTVTLTMTVTGNCNAASDDVVLTDEIGPVISDCPADIVVSISGSGCEEAVNWTAPTAEDNCIIVAFTSTSSPGDTFPMGSTTVTYTATDASGNFSTCSFNVTVEDRISPEFDFCPMEVNISEFDLDTQSAVVSWQTPVASDNCGFATIGSSHNSGDSFPRGLTRVIYIATDESGNETTCEFEINIKGNSFPIASPVSVDAFAGEPEEICLEVIDPDGDNLFIKEINYSTLNGKIDHTDESGLCLIYIPFDKFEGEDIFNVKVCDDGSPVACIDVEVKVQVTINLTLTIYKAFTPDGDNINDLWTIENIDNHPDNQVMVFDRWGGLIFSARGYNNENVVWDGRSNQSGQGPAPSGTYFYKIDLGDGYPTQKGFVELIQ